MTTRAKAPVILVADDERVTRELLSRILGRNGYEVVQAADGAEALRKAREIKPDLIISDVLMPLMDGYELAYGIRQDEQIKNTPIILYTASYTEAEAQSLARECGVNELLPKPIEATGVVSSVARFLDANTQAPSVSPSFTEKHRQLLISKLLENVAQLKEANEKLARHNLQTEQEKERLVSILEATPDFVGITQSLDQAPIYLNSGGRKMLRLPETLKVTEIIPMQFLPEWVLKIVKGEGIPAAIRDGSCVGETAFLAADGTEIPVSQLILAHKSASGEVQYLSTIARDITQQKRLQAQLRKSQKMDAIGRLAAGVAHDFNNMLTVIIGHSAFLAESGLDGEVRASVTAIKEAAERASSLTKQLLAFSRKQILQPRDLDLNEVVLNIREMLVSLAGAHAELRTSFCHELGRVKVDAAQVEQVLVNLVENARDAVRQNGTIVIETSNINVLEARQDGRFTVPPGQYVTIAVSDNGCGMNPEVLTHLFEPFFSTKPLGQAAGLGLAAAYGMVEQSGGYMSVWSEPGRGTTFRIYLPRIDGPDGGTPEPPDCADGSSHTMTDEVLR